MPPSDTTAGREPVFWRVFSTAPHRMMFLPGVLQSVLVMLLWLAELLGRAGLWPLSPLALPAVSAHMFLMLYGVFPFFILGFLFTVYPRWMNGPTVPASRYVPAFFFLAGGIGLFYVGLFISPAVMAAALILQLAGWAIALYALLMVYKEAPKRGPHERLLNLALGAGMLGVGCFLFGMLFEAPLALRVSRDVGFWWFLIPVVFLVSHRMIPFFSQSVLVNYIMVRPAWGPPLAILCVIGHVLLEFAGLHAWRFVADLPLALAALHLSWTWRFRRSFHARLLAMLHIAFLWLGIGMTLYAAQSFLLLATGMDYLGRAPLHALGIGFLTGMMVAMASRVTLGHSGRALAADDLTWGVLLGINVAAVLRLAAEFFPGLAGQVLNVLGAAVWLVSMATWAWLYTPMYLRRRVDGKPG